VLVPAEVRRELERHALEEAPNEACGLVLLRDGRAVGYERGRNERAGLWAARPWLILRTDTRELAAWRLDDGSATSIPLA
jgi:hypothetical protein